MEIENWKIKRKPKRIKMDFTISFKLLAVNQKKKNMNEKETESSESFYSLTSNGGQ